MVHNTHDLGCGRIVERFPEIVARLEALLERFMTALDCVDTAFISDGTLDQLPVPSRVGRTRVGGIDINRHGRELRWLASWRWPAHPRASRWPTLRAKCKQ